MGTTEIGRDTAVGTYEVAGFAAVDFDDFHLVELPRRLRAGGDEAVAWDVAGAAPVAVRLTDGPAYSYVARGDHVDVVAGVVDDAELVLAMPWAAWQDYLHGFRTRYGLLYSQAVTFERGDFDRWDDWEPAIRAMYTGRPVHDPRRVDLRDLAGRPLDLHRSFALDDPPEEMAHFLRTTGWLVVRGAFRDRLAPLSDEVDRLRDEAVEGELWSWWAGDDTGRRFPYRLLYTGLRSPLIAGLDDDPLVRRLLGLAGATVVPVPDRVEGHLVVLKEFGHTAQVTGFANLPWHDDCGFGGCFLTCPCVQVGVQLDAANADSSQLWMLAGTWGKTAHNPPREGFHTDEPLPIVALETEPGDATVHIGCNLHAGPPPTGPNRRRTLYVPAYNPRTYELIGHLQGYQQVIPGWGGGDIPNVEEVQAQSS
jgi:hypothetical protein